MLLLLLHVLLILLLLPLLLLRVLLPLPLPLLLLLLLLSHCYCCYSYYSYYYHHYYYHHHHHSCCLFFQAFRCVLCLRNFAFLLIHSLSATTEQRTPVAVAPEMHSGGKFSRRAKKMQQIQSCRSDWVLFRCGSH